MKPNVYNLLNSISLDGIKRIDVSLEGDWSDSVTTVWARNRGFPGFERVRRSHEKHRPSLEFYFDGSWVGVHCCNSENDHNVFNEKLARELLDFVESRLNALST